MSTAADRALVAHGHRASTSMALSAHDHGPTGSAFLPACGPSVVIFGSTYMVMLPLGDLIFSDPVMTVPQVAKPVSSCVQQYSSQEISTPQ